MRIWYHSGIEGYCKAAARLMGLPDDNSGWGNFGRDLFADGRFDDPVKASKTWTLSRFRAQGRSNRQKIFEDSWLGRNGRDCELEAIHTCVHHMAQSPGASTLFELCHNLGSKFAAEFHASVLPAMEDGFATERYRPSDIARFSQGLDKALASIDPALPQTFRNFAIPLVAGLVYGPDHGVAQAGTNSTTLRSGSDLPAGGIPHAAANLQTVMLTQIFSPDAGLVGRTCTFGEDDAVLLGRNADANAYLLRCDPGFAEDIRHRQPAFFPIAHTHKSTSREHGAMARIGDTWYYHDFSANGTYVCNSRQEALVHGRAIALEPGDRLYLGASDRPADDDSSFHLSTVLLVSFALDETPFA